MRVPDHERVRPDDYRDLMSGFPTGVAVVTSLDDDGEPHGLTCTSLASLTTAPPTLMVSLDIGSGTLAAAFGSRHFAVNLLHARAQRAAETFAYPVACRFDHVNWRPSARLGMPRLVDDAFATADCVVAGTVPVGDHVMVLGEVVATDRSPDLPLLYGLRRFSAWAPAS